MIRYEYRALRPLLVSSGQKERICDKNKSEILGYVYGPEKGENL